jgi:oligosaccharide repeat unit polymerase
MQTDMLVTLQLRVLSMIVNVLKERTKPAIITMCVAIVIGLFMITLLDQQMADLLYLSLILNYILSITFVLIIVLYVRRSWKDRNFNLFSPYYFPLAFFTLSYLFPSMSYLYIQGNEQVTFSNYIHLIGLYCFLIGAIGYKYFFISKQRAEKTFAFDFVTFHKMPILAFYLLGIALLLYYGAKSNVTSSLLSGGNIDDLRRSAEVGKGFIQVPAVFFVNFSITWLIAHAVSKTGRIPAKYLVMLIFSSIVVFITTGHKTQTIMPYIIVAGILAKYKYISPIKIFLFSLLFFLIMGSLTYVRGSRGHFAGSILYSGLYYQSIVYQYNYLPIINMIRDGRMDLQYGKEYIQNAAFIIPRFIYPDKPLSFDYVLKEKLRVSFEGGGLPATPIGSLYLNFGLAGVALGMIALGACYHMVYKMYSRTQSVESTVLSLPLLLALINPSTLLVAAEVMLLFVGSMYMLDKVTHSMNR